MDVGSIEPRDKNRVSHLSLCFIAIFFFLSSLFHLFIALSIIYILEDQSSEEDIFSLSHPELSAPLANHILNPWSDDVPLCMCSAGQAHWNGRSIKQRFLFPCSHATSCDTELSYRTGLSLYMRTTNLVVTPICQNLHNRQSAIFFRNHLQCHCVS